MYDFQDILEKGPYLIVVSGAPGSGKSTLAKIIAERLRMVHIERDVPLEHFYQLNKNDESYSRADIGIKRVYAIVQNILINEASVVMDATLYKGVSESDIMAFTKAATLINVHCKGNKEEQVVRFRNREVNRDGNKPDWLDSHMQVLEDIYEDVAYPLELNCPLFEFDTNHEYSPSVEDFVNWLLEG
ncbi:MAG: putative kinase [Candidatus Saccharimonadales bacterium]|jgi:predicted kinase